MAIRPRDVPFLRSCFLEITSRGAPESTLGRALSWAATALQTHTQHC